MDINKLAALPKPPGALRHQRVELTGAQRKAWTETRAALLWQAPNFAHILYTMMSKDTDGWSALFTSEVAIAATDGVNLLLNPEPFFKLSLLERVFVCAHEIAHAMFDHCGQMELNRQRGRVALVGGPNPMNLQPGDTLSLRDALNSMLLGSDNLAALTVADHKTMNVAQDLVINDMLIRGKVGKYNPDWLHDPAVGTALDSPVTVYERIFSGAEADPSGGGSGGSGEGPPARNGQTGFDQHLRPGAAQGKDPTQARQERNDVEWQSAIRQANQIAKARGKLPSDMERLFEDMLAPKVDWTDRIKGFFARKIGSGSYDWRRPDRRLIVRDIYAPGRSGHNAGLVVIAVDTSGSIGQSELEVFMAEMRGILDDVRP